MTTERDKANLALFGKMTRLSSEMAELKTANEKLPSAVNPGNILRTVGENFDSLQQKLGGLCAEENVRLKLTGVTAG